VDIPTEEVAVGGELRRYDVEINGVKTTMKLTEEDAERMGGTSVTSGPNLAESKSAGAESDKEGVAEEKPAEPAKKRAPARRNKARTASDKTASSESDGGLGEGD
jgi:hypothetical protein